jgi:hypothetical protein
LIVSEDNYQTQGDGRMAAVSPALNTSHVVTEGSPNPGYFKVLSRTTVVHGIFSEYLARSFFEEQFSDSRPTIKTATRVKYMNMVEQPMKVPQEMLSMGLSIMSR